MYLLCSTLCYAREPLETALDRIAEHEFAGIELALMRRSGAHPSLSEAIERPNSLAEWLKRVSPLPVRAVYADFPQNGESDLAEAFRALARFTRSVRATVLTIPPSREEKPLEEEARRLRQYATVAAEEGIMLCVEFQQGTTAGTIDRVLAIHRAAPHVGLTLDVGEFVAAGYDLKAAEPIYPVVQHVHLRDAAPASPSVPLGRGSVDYSRLVSYLEHQGYRGGLTVEYVDDPPQPFDVHAEVRKLRLLMETFA